MGYYFRLSPRPPFRLDLTVWALRRQAHNRMDDWERETYRRVWRYGDGWLKVRLWQTKGDPDPLTDTPKSVPQPPVSTDRRTL
ncbi:hypothetical protein [Acidithiobacillus caldus]|uniref:hypothetical protein n=1 Tax=Acidithiobacillus caldus TaxID=33059 RepID=UPI001D02744B|nr:hypothetical protein [Acidithiobacillus caldus]